MIEMDKNMSELHKRQLRIALPQLEENMEPRGVMSNLYSKMTISQEERDEIVLNATRRTTVTRLIELLMKKPDSAFSDLLTSLNAYGVEQEHIAQLIIGTGNYTICSTMQFKTKAIRQF